MQNRVAIIQARYSSTRLPGKILKKIAGKEILGHVLDRLGYCRNIDKIVVATTTNPIDDRIIEYIQQNYNIDVFRGSESNVLDRYYKAATEYKADLIIRVTSDSPLIDPCVVDFIVSIAENKGYDYVSNSLTPTLPDGLDVESMTYHALAKAWMYVRNPEEREHVTPYIRMHPKRFRLANINFTKDCSSLCWAVDTPADLEFIAALSKELDFLNPKNFAFQNVLSVIKAHPHLAEINKSSQRDHKLIEQFPEIFFAHSGNYANYQFTGNNK